MTTRTVNLIPERNYLFNEESNDWVPVNASIVRSGTEIFQPTKDRNDDVSLAYFALGINPVDHSLKFGATLGTESFGQTQNGNWIQAHMMVYSQSTITVDFQLVLDSSVTVDLDPPIWRLSDVTGGKWGIVRSNAVFIPDDGDEHEVSFVINTITGSEYPLFISIPALISINALFANQFVTNVINGMPGIYYDNDFDDNDVTNTESAAYILRRYLDLGLADANEALLLYLEFIRLSKEDGFDPSNPLMPNTKRSSLIDPLAANADTVQWLSQFAGRNIVNARDIFASKLNFPQSDEAIALGITLNENVSASTSATREAGIVATGTVANAESFYSGTGVVRVKSNSEIDATFDGIFILRNGVDATKLYWDDDEYDSVSSSIVTISEVSYASIEEYAANRLQFSRYQVASRNYGLNSGTITSLVDTIRELLSGEKELVLSYDNQWTIHVQTRINETPTYLLSANQFDVLESVVTPIIPVGHAISFSQLPSSGGERMSLDADPEGRLNLYALGNP
jgi:hypothetical protein